jgi:hypothetical protein
MRLAASQQNFAELLPTRHMQILHLMVAGTDAAIILQTWCEDVRSDKKKEKRPEENRAYPFQSHETAPLTRKQ